MTPTIRSIEQWRRGEEGEEGFAELWLASRPTDSAETATEQQQPNRKKSTSGSESYFQLCREVYQLLVMAIVNITCSKS